MSGAVNTFTEHAFNTDFRAPTTHMPTVRAMWRLIPTVLKGFSHVDAVELSDADREKLLGLSGSRLLLTPNHPSNDEPFVMYWLSGVAQTPFNFIATREAFDQLYGVFGTLIQNIGAYSIVRGTSDRESFRMTRKVLATPQSKLVIFPEGEIYSQNDSLLPFHSGTVQLAFWALDDLVKAGEQTPSILVLPVAIRYVFVEDMTQPIADSLARLEKALGIARDTGSDVYGRLRTVGRCVLEAMEDEYGVPRDKDSPIAMGADDMTPRMERLKTLILTRIAGLLGATLPADGTLPEQMRYLMNSVFAVTREEPGPARSAYREKLHREQARRAWPLMRDLNRIANWIAVQDNYVRSKPTPERMADNIVRLEREVFGKQLLRGNRRAIIRLGDPIDLGEHYAAYKADRRGVVSSVTRSIEAAVQALLDTSA